MNGSVFGKYQFLAQLGEGGMAEVFLAVLAGPRGSGFSKLTVVKKLRGSYEDDPEFISMLVDEASIAARLNHPNCVQTLEVGDVEGKYFMAMEYLDGQSFHRVQNRAWAHRKKPAGDPTISTPPFTKEMEYVVLLDVLAGLHHAHELKDYDGTPLTVVHRDVTPHNIFVTYEGQIKVVDFGIAKAAGRGVQTRHGVIKGKMRYMPPEQALGKSVDRRADLFSVGVLLWETATGERRWKDQSETSIMRALISDEAYVSPRSIDPSVPPEIDAMCQRALSHDPKDRYETAEEMRQELHAYLASTGRLTELRSQIPLAMGALFADKREQLKGVIEKRLSSVHTTGVSEVAPMMLTLHASDQSSRRMMIEQSQNRSSASQNAALAAQAPGTRPWIRAAALVALACVAGGAIVFVATRAKDKPAAAAAMTASTTTTAMADPAVPSKVALSVTATPPTAHVYVDGTQVGAPYEVKLDRSASAQHVVRVEADGYEPQTKNVTLDRDLALSIALVRSSAPDKTATGQPRSAFVPPPPSRGGAVSAKTSEAASAAPVVHAPTPAAASVAAAEPTATATGKPKKDIDRGNPFANGQSGAKGLDKSNPFDK